MKYYEVEFKIQPCSQDARDILAALAGEAGFETFEDTDEGVKGYVQQALFNQSALDESLQFFPMEGTHIIYDVAEAEDKDWNDLPTQDSAQDTQVSIEIDAHLAFGTGTHETTRMICSILLDESLKDKNLLDAGCGTGILGITALKLGANSVTAYDIDEWSSENTRHNAVINQVENNIKIYCGDATLLDTVSEHFDYVVANINRNILLQDMERFRKVMKSGGTLILSGFYTDDIPLLEAKGNELGLTLSKTKEDNNWACIIMREQ